MFWCSYLQQRAEASRGGVRHCIDLGFACQGATAYRLRTYPKRRGVTFTKHRCPIPENFETSHTQARAVGEAFAPSSGCTSPAIEYVRRR